MSSFLSLVAFQLGGGGEGRGPGSSGYAYGSMITVQVCPHINYRTFSVIEIPSFNTKKNHYTVSLKTKNINKAETGMKHQIRVFVMIKKTKFTTGQIVSLKITKTTS